jgi:2-haloacid dehalogenase
VTSPTTRPDAESRREHSASAALRERPALLVFDVNETLSDMSPQEQRFEEVGAPAHLAQSWFAGVLRDGFALTAVHASRPFAEIAAGTLRSSLHGVPLNRSLEDAVEHVMQGFSALPVHADIPEGVRTLAESGIRLVTLSNGHASVAEGLLTRAGIRDHFETLLSVEDAGAWKPAAGAYAYALARCGVDPGHAMLVAVHPWDIDGAARAGLATAWINRTGVPYPAYFRTPDLTVASLAELAVTLLQRHA